jgi:hypothetical protein
MNFHLALKLMALPPLLGSLLVLALETERVSATNATNAALSRPGQATCDWPLNPGSPSLNRVHPHPGVMMASAGGMFDEDGLSTFSDAESDAAAVLFGCDCSTCINALRQLRSQTLFNGGQGHCWTSLQRRVSPQRIQEVLQDLEKRESEAR